MENASKALIIAGGILIAIAVVSIGLYLFENARNVGTTTDARLKKQETEMFNAQFTEFIAKNDSGENLTAQDVATIINLVRDSYNTVQVIELDIKPISGVTIKNVGQSDNPKVIADILTKNAKYKINDMGYDSLGKICKIIIKEV